MKRRTIDASKLRRPLKRSRITESIYGSVFVYLRFFLVWIMVLTADFLLEFRFEYLWPFWMLLRSAYDSFKYQGLAFSLLFLALAFCSDILCLMFLPIHWLFFAASTYVWVQFVWQTERGLCVPTISLWLLFVYVEASVRLRELKNLPFHLDLCRPFAAHCIGYPMVTLGYGVKSYVGYKIRQRRTQQVSRENEFYMQLIAQALPPELRNNTERSKVLGGKVDSDIGIVHRKSTPPVMTNGINTKEDVKLLIAKEASRRGLKVTDLHSETTINEKGNTSLLKELDALASSSPKRGVEEILENDKLSLDTHEKTPKITNGRATFVGLGKSVSKKKNANCDKSKDYEEEEEDDTDSADSLSASCSSASGSKKNSRSGSPKMGQDRCIPSEVGPLLTQLKDEKNARRRVEGYVGQLESDIKRVKADLQASRQCELDLRSHMHSLMASERAAKTELTQLRSENDGLQQRVQSSNQAKQQDRNTIASLERKAKQERDARLLAESQLRDERKRSKAEESAQRQREETLHDGCNSKQRELEEELRQLRSLISEKDETVKKLEKECEHYRKKSKENDGGQLKKETEILMSALTAMQGKNTHLENSLSSETRLKLDLFTALGETRRQLEITQEKLKTKEREVETLKAKIAEVMAVMPATTYAETSTGVSCFATAPFSTSPTNSASTLDPNASVYIPGGKNGLL